MGAGQEISREARRPDTHRQKRADVGHPRLRVSTGKRPWRRYSERLGPREAGGCQGKLEAPERCHFAQKRAAFDHMLHRHRQNSSQCLQ